VERQREADRDETESAASSAPAVAAADAPGATLGRYRIEHELGVGAIGAVHAAFDPDLERRVALKVLRRAAASDQARERLLREARAMARLAHPNVVTVHEAGTAAGRDFIAMELIHGETLADWLRAERRSPAAILDAFLAAGRGLAAAHAAGIVHRDFKPRNVLRSRDGRIAVTDFGLARDAEVGVPLALDDTLSPGAGSPPSNEHGLTVTGALLGTPAYMAPEQWRGDAVTPATDQFAYCVALWEALSGERPYRGPSFDDLRRQTAEGPAALDASRIPRRLRGVLRRGLDPDPARRWPSMNGLLARLERTRRVRIAVILGAALGASAATLVVIAVAHALGPGEPAAASCEPPARAVASVWSPAIAGEVRASTSDAHVAVLDTAHWSWRVVRGEACRAPPALRHSQLRCLDGVLARFDALRQAFVRAPAAAPEELQAQLVNPAICGKIFAEDIPRFALAPTPSVVDAYTLYARSQTDRPPSDAEMLSLISAPDGDTCGRVIGILAFEAASRDVPRKRALVEDAIRAAHQCGDDRLRADLLIAMVPYRRELPVIGARGEAALAEAQAATGPWRSELEAALAMQSLAVARERGQWAYALQLADLAVASYRSRALPVRMLRAIIERNHVRLERSEPGDLDAVTADARAWRRFAARQHAELARRLDVEAALARFGRGEVAAAHAELVQLWRDQPRSPQARASRTITGIVVDRHGRPAAHARVAASRFLTADGVDLPLPTPAFNHDLRDDDLRMATTDARGRFTIADAVRDGVIVAELADQRSIPAEIADHVTLVLGPTRSVSGKVDLAQVASTRVRVYAQAAADPTSQFALATPVAADGSFALPGVPVGALRIGAAICCDESQGPRIQFVAVPPGRTPVTGVSLSVAPSGRAIDVVVRSAITTAFDGGMVILLQGRHAIANFRDVIRAPAMGAQWRMASPVRDDLPRAVRDQVRPGDLVAHFEDAGTGDWTACASSPAPDLLDPASRQRALDHLAKIRVKCVHIGPDAASAVIEVPPQHRLD
jgi:predicted Ser/Thr protein kinase